ncbi:DUF3718 domain-containing protein [Ningiella sp. W23]|uniref:DUF3718 domain-containing protein n=1 Tax=Ningiella sp. W23 TaxID=3023715 RepID=UPI003757C741
MNIIKTALATSLITLSAASIAHSPKYEASDNSYESRLCVAVTQDSKGKIRNMIKQAHPSRFMSEDYSTAVNGITCNGINIADFAREAGNEKVANRLDKYRVRYGKIYDIARTKNGKIIRSEG